MACVVPPPGVAWVADGGGAASDRPRAPDRAARAPLGVAADRVPPVRPVAADWTREEERVGRRGGGEEPGEMGGGGVGNAAPMWRAMRGGPPIDASPSSAMVWAAGAAEAARGRGGSGSRLGAARHCSTMRPARPCRRPPARAAPGRARARPRRRAVAAAATPAALYASLARAPDALPAAVVAAAGLALARPASFSFFGPAAYAPALGFLSFAIGVSLRPEAFAAAADARTIALGVALQWAAKPALAVAGAALLAHTAPPPGVASGLLLVACVSGAQLANYCTFLAAPDAAATSVVLTALSTAAGALLTPALALALLGARLPVDPVAVATSVAQVVILPVAAGVAAATLAPGAVRAARPALAALALLDTCCCVGASLASNAAALAGAGRAAVLPVALFHAAAFAVAAAAAAAAGVPPATARCLVLQGGMQSSLLALLLATRLFSRDPLVAATAGVSTVVMTLGGFGIASAWRWRDAA